MVPGCHGAEAWAPNRFVSLRPFRLPLAETFTVWSPRGEPTTLRARHALRVYPVQRRAQRD